MVILLYHAACALTTVLATPRGEQSSHRKWSLFCITTPHAHQLRILLPHVVNRLLTGNGIFSVLPRMRTDTYKSRGNPERFILQLLHHLVVDLGRGERVVDAP